MEYRTRGGPFEMLTWGLLNGLMWVGIAAVAWNLFKPGGWLFWIIDLVASNQPKSFYYLIVGAIGLLAGKVWLDNVHPNACANLLTVVWAFAGTYFVLRLLLPI